MNYTIDKMNTILYIDGNPALGYAFIDEWGHCIIIAWGEGKKKIVERALRESKK